jgi:hypothetical protein
MVTGRVLMVRKWSKVMIRDKSGRIQDFESAIRNWGRSKRWPRQAVGQKVPKEQKSRVWPKMKGHVR